MFSAKERVNKWYGIFHTLEPFPTFFLLITFPFHFKIFTPGKQWGPGHGDRAQLRVDIWERPPAQLHRPQLSPGMYTALDTGLLASTASPDLETSQQVVGDINLADDIFDKLLSRYYLIILTGFLFFQVDIVTANTYYDILYNWMRLKKLLEDQNRNEIGDYYENHKQWPERR